MELLWSRGDPYGSIKTDAFYLYAMIDKEFLIHSWLRDRPGVIKVYETRNHEKYRYDKGALILEPGMILHELVEKETFLTEDKARPLFAQMVKTLADLHERALVHRNINPYNFLLTGDNSEIIKIYDFEMAMDRKHFPIGDIG